MTGAAVQTPTSEVIQAPRGTPRTKLIHLAWEKIGCPPPTKALCGARIKWEATDATGPDCVVCASLLAGMERGFGE